jgi:hypothetical protein
MINVMKGQNEGICTLQNMERGFASPPFKHDLTEERASTSLLSKQI